MTDSFLPYGRQSIDQADIDEVVRVLKSEFLTTGPAVELFEESFKRFLGCDHSVACANGTAALHLATMAAGIGAGDIAIVPTNTFLATANSLRFVGAEVAFCDIDPKTGLMTPETLLHAIETSNKNNLKAILVVHYAGHCADIEAICDIAEKYGLIVIEDCCHALGTEWEDRNGQLHKVGTGSNSIASTFSLHPVKLIASGEGGVVSSSCPDFAHRLRLLRNHGIERNPRRFIGQQAATPWAYEMQEVGYNYRLSDIHCALAHSQLQKIDSFIAKREQLVGYYFQRLADLSPYISIISKPRKNKTGWHLQVVDFDFEKLRISRSDLMEMLRERKIGSQVHYIPVHSQPYYRSRYGQITLKGAEEFYRRVLSIPLFPDMTLSDLDRVVDTIHAVTTHGH